MTERETEGQRVADEAAEPDVPLLVEFWQFLGSNKKWWLIPLLLSLALIGLLVALGGSAIGPFIYPLF